MAKWYYFNENREKIGPISGKELKQLAQQGTIAPEDFVEDPNGRTGLAKDVKGLTFPETVLPEPEELYIAAPPSSFQTVQAETIPPPAAKQFFCTNCGNAVDEQAVACMSCGARPVGHKKFCRQCGVGLNPEQVVCIKCRTEISTETLAAMPMAGMNRAIPTNVSAFTQKSFKSAVPAVSSPDTFGEVLMADRGWWNKAILTSWVIFVVTVFAIFAMWFSVEVGYNRIIALEKAQPFPNGAVIAELRRRAELFRSALVAGALGFLVVTVFHHICIAGTYIRVQENGIVGRGAGRYVVWGDPSLFGFQLNYDQITSVDTTGTAIFIHASGVQYKCYVKNPAEIQKVIVERQRAGSGA